jgi:hypothetical protein
MQAKQLKQQLKNKVLQDVQQQQMATGYQSFQ